MSLVSVIVPVVMPEPDLSALLHQLDDFEWVKEVVLSLGHAGPLGIKEKVALKDIVEGKTEISRLESVTHFSREILEATVGLSVPVFLVDAEFGKSGQLNLGVRHSSGDYLWFLHADSKINVFENLAQKIGDDEIFYGRLKFFGSPRLLMKLNEIGVWLRCRFWGMPFGDQGFFMRKLVFEKLGPFNEDILLGESHEYAWRAKSRGINVLQGPYLIETSARKYSGGNWLKTTLFHLKHTFSQMKTFKKG